MGKLKIFKLCKRRPAAKTKASIADLRKVISKSSRDFFELKIFFSVKLEKIKKQDRPIKKPAYKIAKPTDAIPRGSVKKIKPKKEAHPKIDAVPKPKI